MLAAEGDYSLIRARRKQKHLAWKQSERDGALAIIATPFGNTRYARQQRKQKQSNCKFFYLTPQLSHGEINFVGLQRLFIAKFFHAWFICCVCKFVCNTKSRCTHTSEQGKLKEWPNRMCAGGNLSAMLTVTRN